MKKLIFLISLTVSIVINAANNWPHDNISNAVFALDVVNRVPKNIVIEEVDNSVKKIYFYTNFRNLAGQKLKHRWIYNNRNMAEINFAPKGNRWRVYSSKNLWKNWIGIWTVEVLNENDEVLLNRSFTYNAQ